MRNTDEVVLSKAMRHEVERIALRAVNEALCAYDKRLAGRLGGYRAAVTKAAKASQDARDARDAELAAVVKPIVPRAALKVERPPTPGVPVDGLATIKRACTFLSMGKTKVYSLIESGSLRATKIGRSRRVRWDDLHHIAAELGGRK